MTKLGILRTRLGHRREHGSGDAIFLLLVMPILLLFLLGFVMSLLYRQVMEQPLPAIVDSHTQQFAAYGSNEIPLYGRGESGYATVTESLVDSLIATGNVDGNSPDNITAVCGPIDSSGQVQPDAVVVANSLVGCDVRVQIRAWPYRALFPGLSEFLFGGEWVGVSTAYSDRGANPNLL